VTQNQRRRRIAAQARGEMEASLLFKYLAWRAHRANQNTHRNLRSWRRRSTPSSRHGASVCGRQPRTRAGARPPPALPGTLARITTPSGTMPRVGSPHPQCERPPSTAAAQRCLGPGCSARTQPHIGRAKHDETGGMRPQGPLTALTCGNHRPGLPARQRQRFTDLSLKGANPGTGVRTNVG
jgi:hypothetical protein